MHLRCFHYCITSIYSLSDRDVELLTGNLAELIKWQQAFFTSLENSSRSGLHLYTYICGVHGCLQCIYICVHCTFVTINLLDLVVERWIFNKHRLKEKEPIFMYMYVQDWTEELWLEYQCTNHWARQISVYPFLPSLLACVFLSTTNWLSIALLLTEWCCQ